jgi:hypothetical protein
MAGYVNPIGSGLVGARIDMGVDYTGRGNLYALGDGTIVNINNVGWPGGKFLCIRLVNGLYAYYAENITPYVKLGQKVTAGQRIAFANGSYPFVEIGWAAAPGTGLTMAAATGQAAKGLAAGDPGKYPTAYGVSSTSGFSPQEQAAAGVTTVVGAGLAGLIMVGLAVFLGLVIVKAVL